MTRVLVCFAVVLLVIGCGGTDTGRQPDETSAPETPRTSSSVEVRPRDAFHFNPSRLEAVPELSGYQRGLLGDGVLTFPEYEGAVLAYVGCVEEQGVIVEHVDGDGRAAGPGLTARGQYLFSTTLPHRPGKRATVSELRAIELKCGGEYFDVVAQLWAEHVAPTEQELAAARNALGTCLRGAGLDVPENPSSSDFGPVAASPAYRGCSEEVSQKFGIPGFGG